VAVFQIQLAFEHLISVGTIDQKTNYADYTTANNHIDLVAPGVSIMTFKQDGNLYVNASGGTSYAAPYISGTAALVFSKNPSLATRAVKKLVVGAAESVGCIAPPSTMPASGFPVDPNSCGAGLLNVASALSATP
jgi:subtilisin family serine protease